MNNGLSIVYRLMFIVTKRNGHLYRYLLTFIFKLTSLLFGPYDTSFHRPDILLFLIEI